MLRQYLGSASKSYSAAALGVWHAAIWEEMQPPGEADQPGALQHLSFLAAAGAASAKSGSSRQTRRSHATPQSVGVTHGGPARPS